MKMDKYKSNSILITGLILIALVSLFIYSQGGKILIIEDNPNPSQELKSKTCQKIDDIKLTFQDFLKNEEMSSSGSIKKFFIRTSQNSPIETYSSEFSYTVELDEEEMKRVNDFYSKNVESALSKFGLIKDFNFSTFNVDYFVYRFRDEFFLISIPTNRESEVIGNTLNISCGLIDSKRQAKFNLIKNKFDQNYILEILEFNDKAVVLNVLRIGSISGYYAVYDLTKSSPVQIYEGQERIKCSLLKDKNLIGGIDCLDD